MILGAVLIAIILLAPAGLIGFIGRRDRAARIG
jgi:ABC-type branched-subunit amino acid transport system permease subunit